MATTYFAIIQPKDYEAFRRLLRPHLPDTYNEWQRLHEDRLEQIRRRGHAGRGIEVDPDEFVVWLSTPGRQPTLSEMDAFAFHKRREADSK